MESKKALAVMLSKMKGFEQPDPSLEQYSTDSEIAASTLWDAHMRDDIEHKHIADLGCGTGILGIGALALGAAHVTFIEIDPRIFPTLMENLAMLEELTGEEYSNYKIVQGNVMEYTHSKDVILQNPPFGTREKGADIRFLEKALALAPIVYSMHKTSTAEHIRKVIDSNDATVSDEKQYAFPLKQTLPGHTKRIHRIEVTCFRITH